MSYFIIVAGERRGPFRTDELRLQDIGPDSLLWCQGLRDWTRASDIAEIRELLPTIPPPLTLATPPPAPGVPIVRPVAVSKAWNPIAIAWLGIVFTPFWSAGMAVLNSRRLGLERLWWRPVGIASGYLAADIAVGFWIDSNLVSALLYLGTVWLIWHFELRRQVAPHTGVVGLDHDCGASWAWPTLAGAPLAILAVFVFVVSPLLPLEPRQVCERFANASSLSESKKYTTARLWPALTALDGEPDVVDIQSFELTTEGPATIELGGYIVRFRTAFVEKFERFVVVGFFHLVNWEGAWKIEEIVYTHVNGGALERVLTLSDNYGWMIQSARASTPQFIAPVAPSGLAPFPARDAKGKTWLDDKFTQKAVAVGTYKLFAGGGVKVLCAIIAGVVAAIWAGLRALVGRSQPADTTLQ